MGLNFFQKFILRANPNAILNTRLFSEITEDNLAFVFSRNIL